MLRLAFDQETNAPRTILCLGAHSDDIEIGCGGAVLRLLDSHPDTCVIWVVFSATPARRDEAVASASSYLQAAKEKNVIVKDFRDAFFPYQGAEIKEFFEQLKSQAEPDLIFTHFRHDLHQDHRLISDLTWNTFRDHLILEYEIPKYDGDLGSPNLFIHLPPSICQKKTQYLLQHFETQRSNHWFTEDTFLSIMRLRGIESNAPDGYAEGFYCRKLTF